MAVPETVQTKLRRLVDAKRRKQGADKEKSDADKHLEQVQADTYDELEELLGDVSTITIDLGEGYGKQQFTRQSQVYAKVIAKDMLFTGLDESALSDEAVAPGFNMSFLNSLVQERFRNGQELPAGLGLRTKRWITVTKR